ncbi:sugar phosphate isomerase/epimerase [Oceanobacillus sp. FSL W8-0428]|uniref:TIM barrel protein n=1 Tax=Oceanobacillus TaxID=182709 RepID=UPI0012EDDCC9
MEKGIFSKVFVKYPLEEAFIKIREFGFSTVQFNFANVGLPSLPQKVSNEILEQIQETCEKTGISISVISGTYNTLELNNETRKKNIEGFKNVVESAKKLNVPYVSISTGSFNQEDFWSPHPENHTKKAWNYLFESLDEMLDIASRNGVTIVIEPEQSNVISTIEDVKKLMNHYQSPYLKVLFDAANIITTDDIGQLENKINRSLKELSEYIAVAHCKDCLVSKGKITFAPIGKGSLPLNQYLKELKKYYDGPVIMHGLDEEDIAFALKSTHF